MTYLVACQSLVDTVCACMQLGSSCTQPAARGPPWGPPPARQGLLSPASPPPSRPPHPSNRAPSRLPHMRRQHRYRAALLPITPCRSVLCSRSIFIVFWLAYGYMHIIACLQSVWLGENQILAALILQSLQHVSLWSISVCLLTARVKLCSATQQWQVGMQAPWWQQIICFFSGMTCI